MRLIIVGPGRAGSSLALASERAGHEIVGILSRTPGQTIGPDLNWDRPLPAADVLLLTVRDEAIASVAERLAGNLGQVDVAAHVSGFVPVSVLAGLASDGVAIGGFHPLQTMPDPERGAAALAGSYVGIGGDGEAVAILTTLADSLAMTPFDLQDDARPAYHAASAAAANFVVTALGVSGDLYASAGIDPDVARPLVQRVIANVFEVGARTALTGPIARGDIDTVMGHMEAARRVSERVGRQYRLMAEATTLLAGREEDLARWK